VLRRNVNMVYIVENNGVYGLTKGQFSATADKGSKSKRGAVNSDEPIDLVLLALALGATFVARGFSGDKAQLVPLIKAAVAHRGAAFIDVVSPCVAFNNHPGSTKSYDYVREHNDAVNRLDFMPPRAPITADYAEGSVREVVLHDGGTVRLRKLDASYDASDKSAAMNYLESRRARGEVVTGLLYIDPDSHDLHAALQTAGGPLNALGDADLVPGSAALAAVNASLR
jgi:2-oxoglutarate ferredoxin oxidoreductase subunit beta